MVGLELVAGYLAAWAARKASRAGRRLDKETDEIMDAGLDYLHEVIAKKLGADPALAKLETEASKELELSEHTARRVQNAVEEATEEDPGFAALVASALAQLEQARASAPTVTGIDLRRAKGVQVGSFNTQTNTFN